MNDFIIYIFKSAIWIVVFYGIYRFFLRNETFLRFNRAFLFTGMLAPFALALCQFRYPVEIMIPVLFETESTPVVANNTIPIFSNGVNFFLLIYIAGAFALFLHYGLGLFKIRKLICRQTSNSGKKPKVIYVPGIRSSFSFFGYVFMDSQAGLQDIEKELILAHETAHINQRHWADILLAQLVCVFQWFNPFAWLYLSAVKQNHEFLADRSVLNKGYSPAVYQAVLVNSTFKIPVFAFTNSFAYYHKFKRITIMKKNVSRPAKKLAVLLLLPALAGFLAAFAQPEYHYSVLPSQPEAKELAPQDTVKKTERSKTTVKAISAPSKLNEESEVVITGQVLDMDGKSIAGAAVVQKNGKQGTVTDMDGKFTLCTDRNNELKVVSFDKEEAIVKLTNATKGKLISITLKDEESKPTKDVVIKTNNSKEPVNATDENDKIIWPNTFKLGSSPLYIIDGQEVTSIENIEIKAIDIESLSVFKDQAAISTYGEKGKNGVIVIKTKEKDL